jgi:hypothetical protein
MGANSATGAKAAVRGHKDSVKMVSRLVPAEPSPLFSIVSRPVLHHNQGALV